MTKEQYIPFSEEVKNEEVINKTEKQPISDIEINEKFKNTAGGIFEGVKIGEIGREELVCDTPHQYNHKNIPNLLAFIGLKDELDEIFKNNLIKEDILKALQQMDDFFSNLSKKEKINQLRNTDSLLLFVASDLIFYNTEVKKYLRGIADGFQNGDLQTISYYNKLFSAEVLNKNKKIIDNYYNKMTSPLEGSPVDFMKEFAIKKDEMCQIALKEIAEKSLEGWRHNEEK